MTLIAHVKAQLEAGHSMWAPLSERMAASLLHRRRHWRTIVREVADKHSLTVDEILSTSRKKRIAHPRQEAMWRIRKETPLSLPETAKRLGLKDHTTVYYGVKAHEQRMAEISARPAKPLTETALALDCPPLPVLAAE